MSVPMKIIDLHCDTITECLRRPHHPLRNGVGGHLNLEMMRDSGALLQCFAAFISREAMEKQSPYSIFEDLYAVYCREIAANPDLILPLQNFADISSHVAQGKMTSMLTIEDAVCLEGRIERVEEFYNKGVRLMTLLWNFENELGFPSSFDQEEHKKGLKPFGYDVIAEMNRLGMLVDISHSSAGVFYDAVAASKPPVVASHSCARALCNHKRNLDDDQLRKLGETGGVVGLNFEPSFINVDGAPFTYQRGIEHLLHIQKMAGTDAMALGSDFDGINAIGEMGNYACLPGFIDRMEKVFTPAEIDKITHENALRVMREALK